ncbi:MAG: OmpA family protein [Rhodoferax sp.]|nr:OmpA family protein [Rhodoferax sp.]
MTPINYFRFLSSTACISLGLASTAVALDANDDAKLKELERALRSPSAPPAAVAAPADVVKKPRTRAIVFDAEPQPSGQPAVAAAASTVAAPVASTVAAPVAAQVAAIPAKPQRIADCQTVAPDAKATPVDFAIQFRSGSADIAPASEETLRQIARILSLAPDRCVLVEGHTDAIGNFDANMVLSRIRSASVVQYIVGKAGMDSNRLIPIGKGPNEPLRNLDPRDPRNRRVVFKVVE